MNYSSVLSAVVSALAAECIDNTSKQAWQKLYDAHEETGDLASLGRAAGIDPNDRNLADCWVYSRLHSMLKERHWHALIAKYSTHKGKKVAAIAALRPLIATPATQLFLYKAVTAWAVPKLKGARLAVAQTVAIDLPVDAPESKQEAIIKAALAAEKVKRKRLESRSADMIVLPDSFYDMNTWDLDGRPESTRREWRRNINEKLDGMVSEALDHAAEILMAEGVLVDKAA